MAAQGLPMKLTFHKPLVTSRTLNTLSCVCFTLQRSYRLHINHMSPWWCESTFTSLHYQVK